MEKPWADLAAGQSGILARRQLLEMGISRNRVRNQVAAGRWALRTSAVISTFTGALTPVQRLWVAALHVPCPALIGGIAAAVEHGLEHWHRDDITVIVPHGYQIAWLPGIRWVHTRRKLETMRHPGLGLPLCMLEPAILLFGASERSPRTARALLAAAVQQRLTTPDALSAWLDELMPLHRARELRIALNDIGGGAQSLGELDVKRMCGRHNLPLPTRQGKRRDAHGRWRYTDCEWELPDGRVVVLEVDGAFHMDVEHWQDDIARQRALTGPNRIVVRCTTRELRDSDATVAADLRRLGVGVADAA